MKAAREKAAVADWFKRNRLARGMTQYDVAKVINPDCKSHSWAAALENRGALYDTGREYAKTLGWGFPESVNELLETYEPARPMTSSIAHWATIPYLKLPSEDLMPNTHAVYAPEEWLKEQIPGTASNDLRFRLAPKESLDPTIKEGDSILFDQSIQQFTGDGVYAFTYQNIDFVRRLIFVGDGYDVRTEQDTIFKILHTTMEEVKIHAKAIGKFMGFAAL